MKPISPVIKEFKQFEKVLAKDQPEYLPLPVLQVDNFTISRWKLSFWERLVVLFTGNLYLQQMNFQQPLQPQLPSVFPLKVQYT